MEDLNENDPNESSILDSSIVVLHITFPNSIIYAQERYLEGPVNLTFKLIPGAMLNYSNALVRTIPDK